MTWEGTVCTRVVCNLCGAEFTPTNTTGDLSDALAGHRSEGCSNIGLLRYVHGSWTLIPKPPEDL